MLESCTCPYIWQQNCNIWTIRGRSRIQTAFLCQEVRIMKMVNQCEKCYVTIVLQSENVSSLLQLNSFNTNQNQFSVGFWW
jgi:hypothetical protein